jgi:O-antigen ligase
MSQSESNLAATSNEIRIRDTLLVLFFVFLPLWPEASIVSFILLAVYAVFTGRITASLQQLRSDTGLKIFLAYYLIHVIGMLYTSNLDYGFRDLETKLSFLLFPLVLAGFDWKSESMERYKSAAVLSAAGSLAVLLCISAYQFMETKDLQVFFYTKLSHGKHVTYLALDFNLAMLFVLERIFGKHSNKHAALYTLVFVIIYSGILLLSARTSTITTLLTILFFPVFVYGRGAGNRFLRVRHFAFFVFSVILFFGYVHLFDRFSQVEEAIVIRENNSMAVTIPNEAPNSTNIRLNIWKNTVQLIRRHPFFGVGTGDIKEELRKVYTENQYEYGIKENPSPHNQFLHTAVILGLAGVLFLLALFAYPMTVAWRKRQWLYFFFLVIVLTNCMTESILERQAGILFFAAFNTCFYLKIRSNSTESVRA